MRRGLIAAALVLLVAVQAQAGTVPAPTNPSYLPLVINPAPTLTPTTAPTPTATNTPVPVPTNTPTLPPPTFNNCQADPNPGAAPNYPVRITAIDKAAETVTLQNVSTSAVDLTGWKMCSITGNQNHPISGTLAPGQSVTFPGSGGAIWNNASEDDGALYTPDGRLASYFNA